jgi:hypothetical protein
MDSVDTTAISGSLKIGDWKRCGKQRGDRFRLYRWGASNKAERGYIRPYSFVEYMIDWAKTCFQKILFL